MLAIVIQELFLLTMLRACMLNQDTIRQPNPNNAHETASGGGSNTTTTSAIWHGCCSVPSILAANEVTRSSPSVSDDRYLRLIMTFYTGCATDSVVCRLRSSMFVNQHDDGAELCWICRKKGRLKMTLGAAHKIRIIHFCHS
jgi:hypothetical protein